MDLEILGDLGAAPGEQQSLGLGGILSGALVCKVSRQEGGEMEGATRPAGVSYHFHSKNGSDIGSEFHFLNMEVTEEVT